MVLSLLEFGATVELDDNVSSAQKDKSDRPQSILSNYSTVSQALCVQVSP